MSALVERGDAPCAGFVSGVLMPWLCATCGYAEDEHQRRAKRPTVAEVAVREGAGGLGPNIIVERSERR